MSQTSSQAPRFDIPRTNDDGFDEGMVFTFVSNPGSLPTPSSNEDFDVK